MIRVILRYVQNTLVISAALLVILAWQRMQSFDYHQNHLYDHFSHQETYGDEYDDPPLGLFGRQMSVGLFRFVFPSSREKLEPAIPAAPPHHGMSRLGSPKQDKKKPPVKQQTVVFVVDITSCDAHWIDAAAVLQHSISMQLKNREIIQLHAILSGHLVAECGSTLRTIGYRTVDREAIRLPNLLEKYESDSCLSEKVRIPLYSTQLVGVDVVASVPLPSLVLLPTTFNYTQNQSPKRASEAKQPTTFDDMVSGSISVHRPSEAAKNALVQDILKACSNHTLADNKDTRGEHFSSWTTCGSICDLTFGRIVAMKNACPLPWNCGNVQNETKHDSSCLTFHERWFQLRHGIESKPGNDDKSNVEVARDSGDLYRRYCLKAGPGGYRAIQR